MSFMENMNLSTLVKISKYKSSHKLNRGGGDQKVLIDLEVTLFLCLLASERGPFLVPSTVDGAREGAAGDEFRVSGTKEMVEGAGANKESGGRFGH